MNQLPPPVARYVAASNAQDAQGVAAAFLPDGTVHDEGGQHRGQLEIAAWADDTAHKYGATIAPRGLEAQEELCTMRAEVSGNFAGSPVTLAFHFVLGADAIESLEITP